MEKLESIKEFFTEASKKIINNQEENELEEQGKIELQKFLANEFFDGSIPVKIVSKAIIESLVKVNRIIVNNPEECINIGDTVCYNNSSRTVPKNIENIDKKVKGFVGDDLYQFITNHITDSKRLDNLDQKNSDLTFALLVMFIETFSYQELIDSKFNREFSKFLEKTSRANGLSDTLQLKKYESKGRILADALVEAKLSSKNKMDNFLEDLSEGYYGGNLNRLMQNFSRIIRNIDYKCIIEPLTDKKISSKNAITHLISPINEIQRISNDGEKYRHYSNNKKIFSDFKERCKNSPSDYSINFFLPICEHLEVLYKKESRIPEEKQGNPIIYLADRRYNIENSTLKVLLYAKNEGEGLVTETSVEILDNSNYSSDEKVDLGLIQSKTNRSFNLAIDKIDSSEFSPVMKVYLKWKDVNEKEYSSISILKLEEQENNIPWDDLRKKNPYSIRKIGEKNKLYGRDEILDKLKFNALSDNIESYKIWGQKRVGKSSIVLTLKNLLRNEDNIIVVYKEIGRNIDPLKTLNELGESLCIDLLDEILSKLTNNDERDRIRKLKVPTFDGSIQPIERYIKNIRRITPSLKFIFILDEFDRLNDEFFLPGNMGETFSLSIGKQLSGYDFIGFILVGAENMSLLDYQEINYNSYEDQRVDTFDKSEDFDAYTKIIKGPLEPFVKFSDKSIHMIYEATDGNPYFTNLICGNIFKSCFARKDSEVDRHNTQIAIDLIVNSEQKSHFAHFWGDGLTQNTEVKREKTTDIRRRILVSFSNFYHKNNSLPTLPDLIKSFNYPESYPISKDEVQSKISSFFTRRIFYSNHRSNQVRIKPMLFEKWLCGKGRSLIIEGVTDLEAQERENKLETQAALKSDELDRLKDKYSFKSRIISINTYRKFFSQFGLNTEQRKIFKLVDNIYYVSHEEITDYFKRIRRENFKKEERTISEGDRFVKIKDVEVYSSSRTIEENQDIYNTLQVLLSINKNKTLKNLNAKVKLSMTGSVKTIIFFEPLIANNSRFEDELSLFLDHNKKILIEKNIFLLFVSFVMTNSSKRKIINLLQEFSGYKIIPLNTIESVDICPFIDGNTIFETEIESNSLYLAAKEKNKREIKESTLVLFENLCPSESLKLLWYKNDQFIPLFHNEFGVVENENLTKVEEEKRRTKIYHTNTKLSQELNQFIVQHLEKKAKIQGVNDWFTVDFIPKAVLKTASTKWIDAGTKYPKESYFDFLDYKKIIQHDKELVSIFNLPGDGLSWCDKLNVLRRDPAHPEKQAPTKENVNYFVKTSTEILKRIEDSNIKSKTIL